MITTLFSCLAIALVLVVIALFLLRLRKQSRHTRLIAIPAAALLLIAMPPLLVALYLTWHILAGQPTPLKTELHDGVRYERRVLQQPRPIVMHVVTIDRSEVAIEFTGSPVETIDSITQHRAATTSDFARSHNTDIAINASFFQPSHDSHLLDFHPHIGDPSEPVGHARMDATDLGSSGKGWPIVNFFENGDISIGDKDKAAQLAVAGNQWIVRDGNIDTDLDDSDAYARTAIGTTKDGQTLIIIVIDGKQPQYSEGMTIKELAEVFKNFNAYNAINLDGGGSSTLVIGNTIFNRPCHTKIPRRERPVANQIGIKYVE